MIKRSIVLLLLLGLTWHVAGQPVGGIKAGGIYNNIIVTNASDDMADLEYKPRFGYHIGSFVEDTLTGHLAWRIEMLFSSKGYVASAGEVESEISLQYLNWPILLVYMVGNKLDIEIGLEPGFLVSGEPLFRNFDLGIVVGLGYRFTHSWSAGLRYTQGFPFEFNPSDLQTANPENDRPRYQHSTFQLSIGYNLIRR